MDTSSRWGRLAVLMLMAVCSTEAQAQWTPVNLPSGVTIQAYESIGTTLFAGTDEGLYSTSNGGILWERLNTGVSDVWFLCLARSDSFLFGGGLDLRGVCVSADTGKTWKWSNDGLRGYYITPCVRDLYITGSRIFAGTGEGVFLSQDNGVKWAPLNNGLTDRNVSMLAQQGRYLFAGTYGGGVFRIEIDGAVWTRMDGGPADPYVSALMQFESAIYAGTGSAGVFVSRDSGATWNACNAGLLNLSVLALGQIGGSICAATNAGLSLSTDEGSTWSDAVTPMRELMALGMYATNGRLYAATGGGCYYSADKGVTWNYSNAGLSRTNIYSMATIDTSLFVCTEDLGVVILGQSSTVLQGYDTSRKTFQARALAGTSTEQFAGLWGGGVVRSTNHGSSWLPTSSGLPGSVVSALLIDSSNVYAGCTAGIAVTTDHGTQWSTLSMGPSTPFVYCVIRGGPDLFAGTDEGVFRSTNGGTEWAPASVGLPETYVTAMISTSSSLFAGTYGSGIFRSGDGGMTWTASNTGLSGGEVVSALAAHGTVLVAGTWSGIFCSTNDGLTWDSLNFELRSCVIRSLAFTEEYLYAGTSNGAYRIPLLALLVTETNSHDAKAPGEFNLDQNFPNPFNSSTTIRYSLPVRAHVTISVFDLLGQEIAVLVSCEQDPGYHDVRVETDGLSSGVYFYRLRVGQCIETRKCVLLR